VPQLTELEGSVLGVIANEGPCTRYRVRNAFMRSLSHHWRASAGAVYPLLARLERAGLIASRSVSGDRRGGRTVSLTASGKAALDEWLRAITAQLAAPPPDPIRTRFHFIARLPARTRRKTVEAWLHATEAALAEFAAAGPAADRIEALARAGTRKQLAARRDWLRQALNEASLGAGPNRAARKG
jgi:DNA-binding PadR family transcriptional regulator